MSLAQLSQLLPLPEEDLRQVLDYANTLSKDDAVSHFSNLLGDSPLAVDFISSFNARRQVPSKGPAPTVSSAPANSSDSIDAVPKAKRHTKKKRTDIHTPQARQVTNDYAGPSGTAYSKKDQDLDYMAHRSSAPSSNHASRPGTPPKAKESSASSSSKQNVKAAPKQHVSSAGFLLAEALDKPKSKSNSSSRSSTPKPAPTKISISGGTPMAGQSTAIADLDAAIRALEVSTNPSLDNVKARRCNCVATRHPIQSAAPNCLSCGKVICMKEGLGPCTFCGSSLLSPDEVQDMIRELKDERGRERMAANAAAHRRAEVSQKPVPFSQNKATASSSNAGPSLAEAANKAREHRDKLLNFQAQNAQRTTVRDEASDFDVTAAVSGTGGNMWSTPEERARELKRQQKIMREMEWNARPEYEKRRQVMSIDVVGGKVVRKMAPMERPATPEESEEEDTYRTPSTKANVLNETSGNRTGGAFSSNPLLGSLMKPIFKAKGKDTSEDNVEQRRRDRSTRWRRVQDDLDNNEDMILDGGVKGFSENKTGDEPACG